MARQEAAAAWRRENMGVEASVRGNVGVRIGSHGRARGNP
jgi:hypothetical protein